MHYQTFSSAETKRLAARIAQRESRSARRKSALVIALSGELGSGKTTFVQGFLCGLGVRKGGASPTFVLVKRYALRDSRFARVYHIDAYRIKNPREFVVLGLKEILADPKNIVLIEWAENVKKILPKRGVVRIAFQHSKKENERIIKIQITKSKFQIND